MNWGLLGAMAALGLAAAGSAIGCGIASQASAGAWKRCYLENKKAPFLLVVFSGMPLSQTIYGFLLMGAILASTKNPAMLLGAGLFGGLGIGASATMQGKAGACAADALASTGKGTANYMLVMGIIETIAIFVMVFLLMSL